MGRFEVRWNTVASNQQSSALIERHANCGVSYSDHRKNVAAVGLRWREGELPKLAGAWPALHITSRERENQPSETGGQCLQHAKIPLQLRVLLRIERLQ